MPDRVVASATTSVGPVTASAVYRFRSGLPFTPRYRAGVDANGDGAFRNDVAFADEALVGTLAIPVECDLELGSFAARNSCRRHAVHAVDARVRVRLGRWMGREASLTLDGLNLIESEDGVIDDALLLVDPTGTISSAGGVTTIPLHLASATAEACPDFMAAEAVVLEYLKAGHVTAAGYATARTECQRRIGELAKRVKSLVK